MFSYVLPMFSDVFPTIFRRFPTIDGKTTENLLPPIPRDRRKIPMLSKTPPPSIFRRGADLPYRCKNPPLDFLGPADIHVSGFLLKKQVISLAREVRRKSFSDKH